MRLPLFRIAVLGAGVLVVSGCSGESASADCPGPQLSITPIQAAPGDTVRVAAEYLRSGCNDYSVNGVEADEEVALTDVPVLFEQGGTMTVLARVDGRGDQYTADVEVVVPASAVSGPAEISIGDGFGQQAALQVTG